MTLEPRDGDPTACHHDWWVPVENGRLGRTDDRHTLEDATMAWCRTCGTLAWGQDDSRKLLVPGLKQLEVWGRGQTRKRSGDRR